MKFTPRAFLQRGVIKRSILLNIAQLSKNEVMETKAKLIAKNPKIDLRGERVMLDRDLAEMYGVETKQLKRAVRRNFNRFPNDFMFQLTDEEYRSLRRQFGTLKRGAHSKYPHNL